jgi:hypothetical protein
MIKCDWCHSAMHKIADHGSGLLRDCADTYLCDNITCGHEREVIRDRSTPSPNGNKMSEKIGSVVLDLLDKYPHLSQAAVQAKVCSILGVAPENVSDVYKEVKEYLRKNVGILFGAEQHQADPDYNYRERRFWRLPITQRVQHVG